MRPADKRTRGTRAGAGAVPGAGVFNEVVGWISRPKGPRLLRPGEPCEDVGEEVEDVPIFRLGARRPAPDFGERGESEEDADGDNYEDGDPVRQERVRAEQRRRRD